MLCPVCGHKDDKVVDSREKESGKLIRRRRECSRCKKRYTTHERIEHTIPMIVKKDGRREEFARAKLLNGLRRASEKRPISTECLEEIVDNVEKNLHAYGDPEVPSSIIGESVMASLKGVDSVAYVRFASVYREFKDIEEFMEELRDLK